MDQGVAVTIATVLVALVHLALGLMDLRRGRHGYAAARLFSAVLFLGVAYYLAVYQVMLF